MLQAGLVGKPAVRRLAARPPRLSLTQFPPAVSATARAFNPSSHSTAGSASPGAASAVSYTHLRAHETSAHL
eukprot:1732009-Alexandrium_andersonii.AAC.1